MSNFYGALPQATVMSEADRCLEELTINGFTVIEDVVPVADLPTLRGRLDAVYCKQREESAPSFDLEEIDEQDQVRAPLCYDDIFIDVAANKRVVDIVRSVLGRYFLIHLQIGIINRPGLANRQSVWHRDLLYHDFVISRPLAISAMVCVDDFTFETGATQVVPFSHRTETMPSGGFIERNARTIEAKAGSAFLMDSMVIHQAGFNSSDRVRRGVNTIYASGLLKQQINFKSQLQGRHADDPFLNMLLGYDAEPSETVLAWRQRRYAKLHGGH
jgi:ectoine hydroxylase-related dioxygenase (phytanoyl-CoA dioxygenase family)